jgi:hypothetical protein
MANGFKEWWLEAWDSLTGSQAKEQNTTAKEETKLQKPFVVAVRDEDEEHWKVTVAKPNDILSREASSPVANIRDSPSAKRTSIPAELAKGTLGVFIDPNLIPAVEEFSRQCYGVLRQLIMFSPDFGYALDNIVQLASTNMSVTFDDDVPHSQEVKMLNDLEVDGRNWYSRGGGISQINSDLLTQLLYSGALSAEAWETNQMDNIEGIATVDPEDIYIFYNKTTKKYEHRQKIAFLAMTEAERLATNNINNYIKLSDRTYVYVPSRTIGKSPYGVPPFMTGLDYAKLEADMIESLQNIVDKIGAFGFLSVLVKKPTQAQADSAGLDLKAAQEERLNLVEEQIAKGFSKGHVVGFEGEVTFEIIGTPSNISGSEAIYEMVNTLKISGLKQDPLMLGRNFSTTEAIGKVILAKLAEQIDTYQRVVGVFWQKVLSRYFLMKGYKFRFVVVEFGKSLTVDVVKEAQAAGYNIDNSTKLYMQGMIGQAKYARRVGLRTYDQEKPRGPVPVGNTQPYPGQEAKTKKEKAAPATVNK